MPLKKCSNNGKFGWKWGDRGHCYTGKDAKKRAIKQGIAIEGPENFSKLMKTEASLKDDEVESIFIDSLSSEQRMIYLISKHNGKLHRNN